MPDVWVHFVLGGVGSGKTLWISSAAEHLMSSQGGSDGVVVVVECYVDARPYTLPSSRHQHDNVSNELVHVGCATKSPLQWPPDERGRCCATPAAAPTYMFGRSPQGVAQIVGELLQHATVESAATRHIFVECASGLSTVSEVAQLQPAAAFSATMCFSCDDCDGEMIGAQTDGGGVLSLFPASWPRTAVGMCGVETESNRREHRAPPCPSTGAEYASSVDTVLHLTQPRGGGGNTREGATHDDQDGRHAAALQWRRHIQHYAQWHHPPVPNGPFSLRLEQPNGVASPMLFVHEWHSETSHPVIIFRLVRCISEELVCGRGPWPSMTLLRVKGNVCVPNCHTRVFLLDMSTGHPLKPTAVRVQSPVDVVGDQIAPALPSSHVVFVFSVSERNGHSPDRHEWESSFHEWLDNRLSHTLLPAHSTADPCSPPHALRFPVGRVVLAHAAHDSWQRAVVVAQWDDGHAYRLRLLETTMDGMSPDGDLWSPLDEEEYVRCCDPPPAFVRGTTATVPQIVMPPEHTAAVSAEQIAVYPAQSSPANKDDVWWCARESSHHGHGLLGWKEPLLSSLERSSSASRRLEILLNIAAMENSNLYETIHKALLRVKAARGGRRSAKPAMLEPDRGPKSKTRWSGLLRWIWEAALDALRHQMERSDRCHRTNHTLQLYPVILKLQAFIEACRTAPPAVVGNEASSGVSHGSAPTTTPYPCCRHHHHVEPHDPLKNFQWAFLAQPVSSKCSCFAGNHAPTVVALRALCVEFQVPLLPLLLANNVDPAAPLTPETMQHHVAAALTDALFVAGVESLLVLLPPVVIESLLRCSGSAPTPMAGGGTTTTPDEACRAAFLKFLLRNVARAGFYSPWRFDCAFSCVSRSGFIIPHPVGPSQASYRAPTGVFAFQVHNIAQVLMDPSQLFYGPRFTYHGHDWYLLLSAEADGTPHSSEEDTSGEVGVYLCVVDGGVSCSFRLELRNECRDSNVAFASEHTFPKAHCGKGWGRGLCTARQTLDSSLGFRCFTNVPHMCSASDQTWVALHTVVLEVHITVHDGHPPPPPPPASKRAATRAAGCTVVVPAAPPGHSTHSSHPEESTLQGKEAALLAEELVLEEAAARRLKLVSVKMQSLSRLEEQRRRDVQHARRHAMRALWEEATHDRADVLSRKEENMGHRPHDMEPLVQPEEEEQEDPCLVRCGDAHTSHQMHHDAHREREGGGSALHAQPIPFTQRDVQQLHKECYSLHQSILMVSAEVDLLKSQRRALESHMRQSDVATAAIRRSISAQQGMTGRLKARLDHLQRMEEGALADREEDETEEEQEEEEGDVGDHVFSLWARHESPCCRGNDGEDVVPDTLRDLNHWLAHNLLCEGPQESAAAAGGGTEWVVATTSRRPCEGNNKVTM